MHDTGPGFQRAKEVHRMIRRVAKEQRHRIILAVAGAQERRGRCLDHGFKLSVADRPIAELDRHARAVLLGRLRQQIGQRSPCDRIVPVDAFGIELFAGMSHRRSADSEVRTPSLFPPPMRGRVREGGGGICTARVNPHPQPLPARGRGAEALPTTTIRPRSRSGPAKRMSCLPRPGA